MLITSIDASCEEKGRRTITIQEVYDCLEELGMRNYVAQIKASLGECKDLAGHKRKLGDKEIIESENV
jgi:hypothetical protein